jgi:4-amino-4-deoxy-L-arabinose transferase-like glycosyltransferase
LTAIVDWFRALSRRYGKRTLIALGAIALLGLVVRAYVVVNPVEHPADDSRAYYALSKALYTEQSFGGPEFRDSSDWSPGAPFLYAAAYYATGGAREGTARIVEALLGIATILVVFALGWRLGGRELGRWVGLFAAFAVAVYPPFIHTTGELMSEPPAMLTLPAAILAFLWASDRAANAAWPWLVPGLLLGLTAMFRPEYLAVALALAVLVLVRPSCRFVTPGETKRQLGPRVRRGLLGAAVFLVAVVLPILPWTIRNVVVLDRVVPISTGGGKALYVGTYLPADGEYQRVKAILAERYLGQDLEPGSEALDEVNPTDLFDEVAEEVQQDHPDLTRDEALGKAGKENFSTYFGEDPWGYAAMTARKVGRMWSSGVGEAMDSTPGRAVQILLVALGLAGFALLGVRRRWWELVVLATPIVLVTGVGAISLAAPRRNEVLMTLVFPLAGLALSSGLREGLGKLRHAPGGGGLGAERRPQSAK